MKKLNKAKTLKLTALILIIAILLIATIYMIPTLLVFLYGEEYLVDGITYQGGVKG